MELIKPVEQKDTFKAMVVFGRGDHKTRIHIIASSRKEFWEKLKALRERFPDQVVDEIYVVQHHNTVWQNVRPEELYRLSRQAFLV